MGYCMRPFNPRPRLRQILIPSQLVGRGGQTILASVWYKVMAAYVTSQMAISPISLPTYKNVFLSGKPSMGSTFRLGRDFIRYQALHSKAGTTWIIISALFVIAFPTISSTMTSYTSNTEPYIQGYDGSMLQFGEFNIIDYVIHDGFRANLSSDYIITYQMATALDYIGFNRTTGEGLISLRRRPC